MMKFKKIKPRFYKDTLVHNYLKIKDQIIPCIGPARRDIYPVFSKYRAIDFVDAEGNAWDSLSEWKRYSVLLYRQNKGLISDLKRQVPYHFPDVGKMVKYIADFTYLDFRKKLVVEDVKNPYLANSKKWAMIVNKMWCNYGLKVKVVNPKRLLEW